MQQSAVIKEQLFESKSNMFWPVELLISQNKLELNQTPFLVFDDDNQRPQRIDQLNFSQRINIDHKDKYRELNQKDGLIYYLSSRPKVSETEKDKDRRSLFSDDVSTKISKFRILVCITIYSEGFEELSKTIEGVVDNLKYFREQALIRPEDIAVVVVWDGCKQLYDSKDCNILEKLFDNLDQKQNIPKHKSMRERIKIFLDNENKQNIGRKSHYPFNTLYTYQTRWFYDDSLKLTTFFCVKLSNGGKLSSHAAYFRGFCEHFQPQYTYLLDVGTIPQSDAFFKMFKAFEGDPQIGGLCGYLGLNIEPVVDNKGEYLDKVQRSQYDFLTNLFLKCFSVQRAQKFEYSFANTIDKSFESLFGYIHVLPGAYSAYRWKALRRNGDKNTLEETYLKSVLDPEFKFDPKQYTLEVANMMLAEDRILCLDIFTKKDKNYIHKYIPDARAYTDSVKFFYLLMKQRRRWINGSWHALSLVLRQYPPKLFQSNHTILRKFFFNFSMIFAKVSQATTYLVLGFYFIFLQMSAQEVLNQYKIQSMPLLSLDTLIIIIYILSVFCLIYYSLQYRRPEDSIKIFSFISTILGLFMLLNFVLFVYVFVTILFNADSMNSTLQNMVGDNQVILQRIIIINICLYIIPNIFTPHIAFFECLLTCLDYIYYSPAYLHTLLIFAFCNFDDMSWGTKGLDSIGGQSLEGLSQEQRQKLLEQKRKSDIIEQEFKKGKVQFVSLWILINILFAAIIYVIISDPRVKKTFILVMAFYFTIVLGLRSVSSFIYQLKYFTWEKYHYNKVLQQNKQKYDEDGKEFSKYIEDLIQQNESNHVNSHRRQFDIEQGQSHVIENFLDQKQVTESKAQVLYESKILEQPKEEDSSNNINEDQNFQFDKIGTNSVAKYRLENQKTLPVIVEGDESQQLQSKLMSQNIQNEINFSQQQQSHFLDINPSNKI